MQSNNTKSRIGINRVSTIVENLWSCGWQEYAAQNDDAFDGIVIMKRGEVAPVATGGLVFVQVKCGSAGYKELQAQYPDHIGVKLGGDYIEKHLPRWHKAPGPVVLIFVDDESSRETPPAYWVDLRADAFSEKNKGLVLVPKSNVFAHHAKGAFHRLCGSNPADLDLHEIVLGPSDSIRPKVGIKSSLRKDAWDFYRKWKNASGFDVNPVLGPIIVNRVAWDHMLRPGRYSERVVQSWLLLGAAKRMINECSLYWTFGNATEVVHTDGNVQVQDYLGLRARIISKHRHQSIVQVVLRRVRLLTTSNREPIQQKIWFYSVYELRRGQ
jgi:hypothetical protein